MLRIVCASVFAGGVGALASVTSAQPLIDNLDQPTRAATVLGVEAPNAIWAAQGFSTPRRVQLDSIDVLIGESPDGADAVAELRVGDDPSGPAIVRFTVPAIPAAGLDVATLVPDSNPILQPGKKYWLVMGTATTGWFGWAYAMGNSYSGEGAILEYRYSEDAGATWGAAGSDDPYQFRVNVTTVCACPADFDGTGFVDTDDFTAFVLAFEAGTDDADFDGTGFVDTDDFTAFVLAFEAGC
jgi:hypothetical protein